jgi:dodecin
MSEHVYKQIELTGSSKTGADDAFRNAIAKTYKNIDNLHWFQVIETRENIESGEANAWQVTIKATFSRDDNRYGRLKRLCGKSAHGLVQSVREGLRATGSWNLSWIAVRNVKGFGLKKANWKEY